MTLGNLCTRIRQDWARRARGEGGFTAIELLIVVVILPLILGAAADAVIISLQNNSATSKRLADSDSAQITAANFVRDVQTATYITTDSAVTAPYSNISPQLCPPTAPTGGTLQVALYRQSPGFSVGYWLVGSGSTNTSEIVRYSCSVSATYTTTQLSQTAVVDLPISLKSGSFQLYANTSIDPSQFSTAAAAGWTQTSASTLVAQTVALGQTPNFSITVESTSGFTSSNKIIVDTGDGPQAVSCSGITPTSFTTCTGGSGVATTFSSTVTQGSITGVHMNVSEPSSSYDFGLDGSPNSGAGGSAPINCGTSCHTPTLLALGTSGISIGGGGNSQCSDGTRANLCITGQAVVDDGDIGCPTGTHTGIEASGGVDQASGSSSNCTFTITPVTTVLDPIAPNLPQPCFALTNGLSLSQNPSAITIGTNTYQVPGIYTGTLSGTLEPGVYVAEGGTGNISMAPADNNGDAGATYWTKNSTGLYDASSGVLIYIPGPAGAYTSQCSAYQPAAGTPPSIGATGTAGTPLSPITSNQSQYWFSGSTAESDMWLWQDAANSSSPSLNGSTTISTSCGMMYAPSAQIVSTSGTPSIATGSMVVGGISVSGGGNGTITLNGC